MTGPAPGIEPRGAAGGGRSRSWRVVDLLLWTSEHFAARGIESARLDAECLLAHALGTTRLRLYLDHEKPVLEAERARFRALVKRRADERVPVAQLVGEREFWSLSLVVTPDVLTPRPETETLVEAVLEGAPERAAPLAILDLGTGSGAIALALLSELPDAQAVATDVSGAALCVAARNAERHGLAGRLTLREGDLFAPVADRRFDWIVANPPYIAERAEAGLPPELAHEPSCALFAGPDGLDVLRRIAGEAGAHLRPGGGLVVEIGPEQAPDVTQWLESAGFADVRVRRDLAGRPRAVQARLKEG